MGFFYKIFTFFDIFQVPFNLNFNQQNRVSSPIGIFFSFIIIALIFYNFITSDFILKENPIIVTQTVPHSFAAGIQYSKDNLLSVNLADDKSNKFIDPTIFRIAFTTKYLVADENGNKLLKNMTSYKLHPCSPQDMPQNNSDMFNTLNLNNSLCLENKNVYIKGQFDEDELIYFIAELYMCDNVTSNNTCKPKADIINFLSSKKFFSVFSHDIFVDLNDYLDPMKVKTHLDYYMVDPNFMKRYNIFIKRVSISTDDGIFFSQDSAEESFAFDYKDFDFMTRNEGQPLFQFLFYASKNSYETNRRYQNFQDLLGSLTGIGSLLMIIMTFIVGFYTKVEAVKEVLNCLYVLPRVKKPNKKLKINKMLTLTVSNNKNNKLKSLVKPFWQKKKNEPKQTQKQNFENRKFLTTDQSKVLESNFKSPENAFRFPGENEQTLQIPSLFKPKVSSFFSLPQSKLPSEIKVNIMREQNQKNFSQISNEDNIFEDTSPKANQSEMENLHTLKEKIINDKKMQMDFTVWEYVKYLISEALGCKKSKKYKSFSRAINVYEKEIDLLRILTKLHDLEKMKILFFNDAQMNLFNTLSKPILDFEEEPQVVSRNRLRRNSFTLTKIFSLSAKLKGVNKSSYLDFGDSYKIVNDESRSSEVNKRLLKLVNLDLMKFKEKNF